MTAVLSKVVRPIKDFPAGGPDRDFFPAGGPDRDFQRPITFSGDKTSKNVKRKAWK